MRWFHNLKISNKLLISFLIVALIGGFIGFIGATKLRQIDSSYADLIDYNAKPVGDIGKAAVAFQQRRTLLRDLFLTSSQDELQNALNGIKEKDRALVEDLNKFEKTIKSPEIRKEYESLKAAITRYDPEQEKILKAIANQKKDEGWALMKGDALQLAGVIQKSIEKLMEAKIVQADKQSDENTAATNTAISLIYTSTGLGMVLAVILGFSIARLISRPLQHLAAAADKLALGDCERGGASRNERRTRYARSILRQHDR